MSTVTEDIPLGATLTDEQARQIYSQGEEAVVFAFLQLAKQLAEQKAASAADSHQTPSTPSGMNARCRRVTLAKSTLLWMSRPICLLAATAPCPMGMTSPAMVLVVIRRVIQRSLKVEAILL
jgi:hypothetical protein